MRISDAGPPERGFGWSRCARGVVANNRRLYPAADAQDSGFLSALRHDDDGGHGGVDGNGSTRSYRKGLSSRRYSRFFVRSYYGPAAIRSINRSHFQPRDD